jgi:hypothetical protein
MIGARGIWAGGLAATALVIGFIVGYPAEVGAATALAIAALVSLITTRDLAKRALRRANAGRPPDGLPLEQLRRVEDALGAACASERGIERDLRPLFRAIAAMRLARRGIDVDRDPEQAQTILGGELWELVRSGRSRSNPFTGGISRAALEGLIERLEGI